MFYSFNVTMTFFCFCFYSFATGGLEYNISVKKRKSRNRSQIYCSRRRVGVKKFKVLSHLLVRITALATV